MTDSNASETAVDGSAASLGSHTPGPWKVSRRFDIYEDLGPTVGGTYVGTTRGNRELPESINLRCEADARLIAAAPEMLKACRMVELWMLGGMPGPHSDEAVLELVRSAIHAATKSGV